jgi:ABC-type transport system substrate-binding protein/DNA-binding SARP family transcriptional activator
VLEFRILGPFEVLRDGHRLPLTTGKQKALLAFLLLHANRPVSSDHLIEALWNGSPPRRAAKSVHVYISQLRKLLGEGVLVSDAPGYMLRVDAGAVDAGRFESLLAEARAADAESASETLRTALALWRGDPLVDFAYESFAQDEIRRLEELKLTAIEERVESELALGRHAEILAELEALAGRYPAREGLQAQRMLALYRCGRQADALAAYRSTRRALLNDVGIEPGPELQRLERAVLAQNSALELPPSPAARRAVAARAARLGSRGRLLLGVGIALVAAAGVGLGLRLASSDTPSLQVPGNAIGVVDVSNGRVTSVIRGVESPGGIAYADGAVWVADTPSDSLLRIAVDGRIDRIPVGDSPVAVAAGEREIWVANDDRTVSEVNPRARRQVGERIRIGNGPVAIAVGRGSVWVANATDETLSRIDPRRGDVVATVPLGSSPSGLAVGREGVWVTSATTGELLLVDPAGSAAPQRYEVGNGPTGVAVGGGAVWVANGPDATVTRFDPRTAERRKVEVDRNPDGVAYGDGFVWVAGTVSGTVTRIDPSTRDTVTISAGSEPTNLTTGNGRVWFTAMPSRSTHRGGTLRLVSGRFAPEARQYVFSIDPAVTWAFPMWQILTLTNDTLVTYRRVSGAAGTQLVPDLATALPTVSDGGRTYTLQLRPGIRYSNGELVRPADFRHAIERLFKIPWKFPPGIGPSGLYHDIVGASACAREHKTCSLAEGIVANRAAGTVTFHLSRPDPDFPYRLSFPFASAVPAGTPARDIGTHPLPATRPYKISTYVANRRLVVVRNPRFREWSAEAQPRGYPDRIVWTFVGPPKQGAERALTAVERGQQDVLMNETPSAGRLGELLTRYADQVHTDPVAGLIAVQLNTLRKPFDSLLARRALNYAVDRRTVVERAGGLSQAKATCQFLPPNRPGYRPYCPYTDDRTPSGAPELARARTLVRASRTSGTAVSVVAGGERGDECGFHPDAVAVGRYVVAVLRQLGYRATLDVCRDPSEYVSRERRPHITFAGWFEDIPSPADFLPTFLACRQKGGPGGWGDYNLMDFCSPKVDRQMRRAFALQASEPTKAKAYRLWSQIDTELVDQAPWVPLYTPQQLTVLSRRVGNYQFHPFWVLMLDQLWVR